jgi:hypothetical protein
MMWRELAARIRGLWGVAVADRDREHIAFPASSQAARSFEAAAILLIVGEPGERHAAGDRLVPRSVFVAKVSRTGQPSRSKFAGRGLLGPVISGGLGRVSGAGACVIRSVNS